MPDADLPTTRVLLSPYGALEDRSLGKMGTLDLAELGLPESIVDRLQAWWREWDHQWIDPESVTPRDEYRTRVEGFALALDLQRWFGQDVAVLLIERDWGEFNQEEWQQSLDTEGGQWMAEAPGEGDDEQGWEPPAEISVLHPPGQPDDALGTLRAFADKLEQLGAVGDMVNVTVDRFDADRVTGADGIGYSALGWYQSDSDAQREEPRREGARMTIDSPSVVIEFPHLTVGEASEWFETRLDARATELLTAVNADNPQPIQIDWTQTGDVSIERTELADSPNVSVPLIVRTETPADLLRPPSQD